MELSIDRINSQAAYPVQQLDELTFTLTTDSGAIYDLGFYADQDFLEEGAYYFFFDNRNGSHSAHDPKLAQTIFALIEEFFRQDMVVMLYICEYSDNRQAARNRLYRTWLNQYMDSDRFTLYSETITLNSEEYFAGLLIQNTHPAKSLIIDAFHHFVQLFAKKLALQK